MTIVSVIVPCFNQAAYVGQAVASALGSSHEALEVIVVDDGSTDDPATALKPFAQDPRLRLLRQANAGVAAARNFAISQARGDAFHFLDADDWIATDMLHTMVDALEKDHQLGMVYCDITHVDSSGNVVDDYSVGHVRDQLDGDLLPSLLMGGYFPPVCVVVTRKALEAAGLFDPPLGGCCDWDLWARIAARGFPARYIDRKLAFYRLHDASMSRDGAHMHDTMGQALRKLMRIEPDRAAGALHALIERNESLFQANRALGGERERLLAALDWHAEQARLTQQAVERLNEGQPWATDQQHSLEVALENARIAWKSSDDALGQARTASEASQAALLACESNLSTTRTALQESEAARVACERALLASDDAGRASASSREALRQERDALTARIADLAAQVVHLESYLNVLENTSVARLLMNLRLLPRPANHNKEDDT